MVAITTGRGPGVPKLCTARAPWHDPAREGTMHGGVILFGHANCNGCLRPWAGPDLLLGEQGPGMALEHAPGTGHTRDLWGLHSTAIQNGKGSGQGWGKNNVFLEMKQGTHSSSLTPALRCKVPWKGVSPPPRPNTGQIRVQGGESAETWIQRVWTTPCYCAAHTMEHMLQT